MFSSFILSNLNVVDFKLHKWLLAYNIVKVQLAKA